MLEMSKVPDYTRETVNAGTVMRGPYADIRAAVIDIQIRYPSIKFPLKSNVNPDGIIVSAYPLRIVPKGSEKRTKRAPGGQT